MKITKRQLRRIIKETHPDYQGLPQSDVDYYELVDDYTLWVEDFGQGAENPNRPDVMASYFLEKGLEDDHEKHKMLGKAFQVKHSDIMKELELQAADQKAAEEILSTRIGNYSSSRFAKKANEGFKMKITKRQLRRIIKEEKAKLLKEAEYDPLSELYDIQQELSDAGHKLKEVSQFIQGSDDRRAGQFDNLSKQILKINTIIETHVKTLEDADRRGDDEYKDYKPTERTPNDPYGNRKV